MSNEWIEDSRQDIINELASEGVDIVSSATDETTIAAASCSLTIVQGIIDNHIINNPFIVNDRKLFSRVMIISQELENILEKISEKDDSESIDE